MHALIREKLYVIIFSTLFMNLTERTNECYFPEWISGTDFSDPSRVNDAIPNSVYEVKALSGFFRRHLNVSCLNDLKCTKL
jgi:hypothetical protein